MPTVLQGEHSGGQSNFELTDPLTIGHVLLAYAAERQPSGNPVPAMEAQGWTFLDNCVNHTGFDRGGSLFWKFAEATDENWNLDSPDLEWIVIETDATILEPVVVAVAEDVASSSSMNCGGSFTPAEGDDILAIGFATVGNSDNDYDTLPNPITPYAGVTGVPDDGGVWTGSSPLLWSGWLSDALASGDYIVGGTNARPKAYCGITVLIASSPAPPEITPPIACALDDEDLAELVCIEASSLESWSIRIERQGTGSGHVRVHRSLSIANEAVVKKGNWIAVKIPQIQEDALFTFAMERLTTTIIDFDEGGGELMQVAGRGNLCYLERAKAYPRSFENGGPVTDLSGAPLHGPAATGNKAGQILRRSIDEWQSTDRGVADFGFRLQPIAHVTTDFDYNVDSDGNTWATTTMTEELSQGYVGDSGLNGIMELIGTNEIDIIMWPSFLLQGFNSYGRDLTGAAFGTGVVRFVRGENIAERLVRDEGRAVDPNLTVVEGQDNTFAFAEAPTAATSPHVEGYIKTFGTDTSALEAIGIADMARRVRQGESVQYRVKTPRFGQDPDEATGLYLPGPPGSNGQYWIGDTVTLNTGDGFRDYDEVAVRVEAIVITSDDAGDLEVIVELKAVTLTGRFGATTGTPGGAFGNGTAPGTGGGAPAPPPGDVIAGQHIIDPTDAHDASAISVVPFSSIASTNVQDALEEIVDEIGGGDADEVHVNEEIVGGPGPTVEADLAELFGAVDWAVDSVGSLTQDGSPQSIINDAFWNEFPGSVRLDARRVLTVYRGLATSHAANGQICGQILTLADDHKSIASIGDRFSILDDAEDLRVEDGVSIVEDQDGIGRLVVPFRYFDGADNHDPSYIICDDLPTDFTEASTWGSPIALPDPGGSVQKYTQGRLRRLSNGTYMLGGGFDSGGDHTVGVWRWTGDLDDPSGATFVTVGSGSNDYSEITFEELPDTTVRALLRSDDNDDIDMKTSADFGATWSSVSNAYDGHGNPMARYFMSGLGLTVYRDAPNGDTAWRPTTDFGATWGSETILSTTGVRSAYATLLQITPNDILCIFAVEHDSGGASGTADLYYDWFRDSSTFAPTLSSEPTGAAGGDLSGTYPNPSVVDDSHNHTSATVPSGVGEILISDTPSTPLVFADLIQNEAQDDLVYADP